MVIISSLGDAIIVIFDFVVVLLKVFGTCSTEYITPYIVMNAAIGASSEDIISAVERFGKAYDQITQK